MINPVVAYFLGLLTIVIIFLIFWALALVNPQVGQLFSSIFCSGLSGN